ncbi:porin [Rhodobacter calidifons]|uniref:Porin n=1 Tax=Rhodobacter calidifons TaxID=2715277 RepID=A0ABX0G3Y1_9RHOB|nr:porin [Rhodobacter calidifons]NHB75844.1 porin [Rhodobacter calidifons]
MKKILLATSALVMVAGAAAAEVKLSGSARMGLIFDGEDTLLTSRVRVVFTMSGETDTGLSFGASMRSDQFGGNQKKDSAGDLLGSSQTGNNDSTVYVSGPFGKLTLGDVDTAAEGLVGHVSGVGLTGLGDWNELRYLGHEKTAALYEYSAGDLTFALSAGQIEDLDGVAANDDAYSVAVKYAPGDYSVALGYETAGGVDHIALGASATFGGATVKFVASDTDISGDPTQYALSLDYKVDAATFTIFATDEGTTNNYGIGAAYDLGGGAKVVGGIVKVDDSSVDDTIADLGLSFKF